MNHDTEPTPDELRLVATGNRAPVWDRLPDEPPHADHIPVPTGGETYAYTADGAAFDTSADTWPAVPTVFPPARFPSAPVVPASGPVATAASSSPSPKKRRSPGWLQTVLAGVLGAVLAVGGLQIIQDDPTTTLPLDPTAAPAAAFTPEAPNQPPATLDPLNEAAGGAVAIGNAVIPSIVTVQVGSQTGEGLAIQGTGSGVIVQSDGYIVTNDHVISVGSAFEVVLSDGRTTYSARLIGTDPLTDLAVLKIEATGLTAIAIGDTSTLQVGDAAVAVGSPLGLEGGPSLTVGVVSAFERRVQVSGTDTLYGMIQTDAPITQGSSGGALVDGAGRLIGITTAVGVSSVGVEGIGFATPVELMLRVTDEIIATGSVQHAFLGIFGATTFTTATDGASVASGVEVTSVEANSAAGAAGLVTGDIITAVDGDPVTTMEDLIVALRYRKAGDAVALTVTDGLGAESKVNVLLGIR